MDTKDTQLQIRVSTRQKRKLQRKARAAGMSLSEWVLALAFPPKRERFELLVRALASKEQRSFALAGLHDFLAGLEGDELERILEQPAPSPLAAPDDALVAAMIEHAASLENARIPEWVARTPPAAIPFFASELKSLRLHLLVSSPPAFRRRNLFVDTSIGGRV